MPNEPGSRHQRFIRLGPWPLGVKELQGQRARIPGPVTDEALLRSVRIANGFEFDSLGRPMTEVAPIPLGVEAQLDDSPYMVLGGGIWPSVWTSTTYLQRAILVVSRLRSDGWWYLEIWSLDLDMDPVVWRLRFAGNTSSWSDGPARRSVTEGHHGSAWFCLRYRNRLYISENTPNSTNLWFLPVNNDTSAAAFWSSALARRTYESGGPAISGYITVHQDRLWIGNYDKIWYSKVGDVRLLSSDALFIDLDESGAGVSTLIPIDNMRLLVTTANQLFMVTGYPYQLQKAPLEYARTGPGLVSSFGHARHSSGHVYFHGSDGHIWRLGADGFMRVDENLERTRYSAHAIGELTLEACGDWVRQSPMERPPGTLRFFQHDQQGEPELLPKAGLNLNVLTGALGHSRQWQLFSPVGEYNRYPRRIADMATAERVYRAFHRPNAAWPHGLFYYDSTSPYRRRWIELKSPVGTPIREPYVLLTHSLDLGTSNPKQIIEVRVRVSKIYDEGESGGLSEPPPYGVRLYYDGEFSEPDIVWRIPRHDDYPTLHPAEFRATGRWYRGRTFEPRTFHDIAVAIIWPSPQWIGLGVTDSGNGIIIQGIEILYYEMDIPHV